jgi:hypothetical protein
MDRISSTLLLEAASNSKIFKLVSAPSSTLDSLMILAKIRAHEVLPTPLGPQNNIACGIRPDCTACSKVSVMWD